MIHTSDAMARAVLAEPDTERPVVVARLIAALRDMCSSVDGPDRHVAHELRGSFDCTTCVAYAVLDGIEEGLEYTAASSPLRS